MPRKTPALPSRRSIRLHGYDYSRDGAYFVTVCAHSMLCSFGQVREDEILLNDLGKTVEDCWQRISQVRHNIQLDAFVVMPNHIHGIIIVFDEEPVDDCQRNSRQGSGVTGTIQSGSLGVIVGHFKRAVTIRSTVLKAPPQQPIWQRNFYEHIIRNERSLDDIRKYIVENPARWHDDELYAE